MPDGIVAELDAWLAGKSDERGHWYADLDSDSRATLQRVRDEIVALRDLMAALQVLLDQVDYTSGVCSLTEMVGAVLQKEVIAMCRERLAAIRALKDKPHE